jgi:hypothetical protein
MIIITVILVAFGVLVIMRRDVIGKNLEQAHGRFASTPETYDKVLLALGVGSIIIGVLYLFG